jgi:hypothetical protein
MRRIILLVTVAAVIAAMMALAGPAFADHDHNLTTPGTTVEDVADGQTEKCASEPGGHKFHENVHVGQPGDEAFANENNPVSVDKTEDATC